MTTNKLFNLFHAFLLSLLIISCSDSSDLQNTDNATVKPENASYTLENDFVRFSLDNEGRLVELINKITGTNYAGGGHFWRLIYEHGNVLEEEFDNNNSIAEITQKDNLIELVFNEKDNPGLAFCMNITVELVEDNLNFDMSLENHDENNTIRECQFPFIKNLNLKKDHSFYNSKIGGEKFDDVEGYIVSKHSNYIAKDNKEIQASLMYPERAALNFYILASEKEGLYMGSHDTTFQLTNHYLSKFPEGGINCAICKYPFLKPGGKTDIHGNVLSPYSGTWHVAAKKYRKWADTWYAFPRVPEAMKQMTSWQRIAMRHQYGTTLFWYKDMEKILHDGLEAGIKTLFLFAWHTQGHDAGYPDYSPDEAQGGFKGLKENIQKFQAGGGKVILYFNGRLIDVASDFYKEKGHEVSIKRPDGSEHNEFYKFGADGTTLRFLGNKSFVTACPSSKVWQNKLKEFIDISIDLGCDGVFFDQLGFISAVCHDPNHGHKVPFTDIMKVNATNLKDLREYAKSKNPDILMGIEWATDVTAQYVDFVHNVCPGSTVNNDWQNGEKPSSYDFKELFYYTFPDVIISDREIRDDTDVERRVNFAIHKGLLSDVEVYRCRATIAEAPKYKEYLKKANALREKYADLLLGGYYRDTDYFKIDNPEFFATSFEKDNKLAVVISQSHLEHAKTTLKVPGYKYVEHDGINDFTVKIKGDEIRISTKRHALVVVAFEKE